MTGIPKLEAAKRQVDTAIRMLFNDEDPLSVHTLHMAAFRILRDLGDKSPKKGQLLFDLFIVPGKEREFWSHVNKHSNFLKHADGDPSDLLTEFNEESNLYTLFFCCYYYRDLAGTLTTPMGCFLNWMMAIKPALIKSEFKNDFSHFPEFETFSRKAQLETGRIILSFAVSDLKDPNKMKSAILDNEWIRNDLALASHGAH